MFRLVRRLPCGFPYACTHTGVAVRPACAWMEWAERARGSSLCAPTQLQHAHARRPHAAFSRHGTVKDVTMKEGYCFVIFDNSADAEDVISRMDGYVHAPPRGARCPAVHPVRPTAAPVAPASVAAVPVGTLQKAEASRAPGKGKGETFACSGLRGGLRGATALWDPSFPCSDRRCRGLGPSAWTWLTSGAGIFSLALALALARALRRSKLALVSASAADPTHKGSGCPSDSWEGEGLDTRD